MRLRAIAFCLTSALIMAALRSAADDLPLVRVLPSVPVGTTSKTLLDSPLPASQEFTVEVPPADEGTYASGVLEIWPAGDCDKPAGPQHYTLALAPAGDPIGRVLRARVAALQIRQPYCLRATRNVSLSETQAQELVTSFAVAIGDQLSAGEKPGESREALFARVLSRLAAERGFVGNATGLAAALYRTFERSDGGVAYAEYRAAVAKRDAEEKSSLGADLGRAEEDAKKLPDLAAGTPPLEAAAFATLQAYRANARSKKPEDVLQALDDAKAKGRPALDLAAWADSVARFQRLVRANAEHEKALHAARQDADAKEQAFLSKLGTALQQMRAIPPSVLRQPLGVATVAAEPGESTTPSTGNYASIDAGIAVAFPTGGGAGAPWFLPYVGANLYFAPVERVVPFDKLAGTKFQRLFLQRFSLTAGFSLASPSLPGRTVGTLLFGKYPLLAGGYRVAQYVRVTGGCFFYQLSSRNPTINRTSVEVAPFVGLSLDLDMVHFITTGFAGVK